jgi:hypothetical protein
MVGREMNIGGAGRKYQWGSWETAGDQHFEALQLASKDEHPYRGVVSRGVMFYQEMKTVVVTCTARVSGKRDRIGQRSYHRCERL